MRNAILKAILALAATFIAGCAASESKDTDVCPPNQTLVCETRMGQSEECTCRNKAQMRDVFDLSRGR